MKRFAFFVCYLCWLQIGWAQSTWDGDTDTDWTNAANWDVLPGTGDDVIIPTGLTFYPDIVSSITVAQITIDVGGSLTVSTGGTLTCSGAASSESFYVNGTLTQDDGIINAGDLITITGTFNMNGGTFNGTANASSTELSGTINQAGGTYLTIANVNILSGGSFNQSGGTLHLASTLATDPSDDLIINAGAAVVQTGGTIDVQDFSLLTNSTATYTQSESSTTALLSIDKNYINTGGVFTSTAGTIEWTGVSAASPTAEFDLGTNQFFNVTINGTLDVGFANDVNGAISVRGNWTNNNSVLDLTSVATTVTFNGTGNAQTIGGTNATTFYDLIINNTFGTSPELSLGVATVINNALTMTAGNIDLATFSVTLGTAAATPGTLSHTSGYLYGGDIIRYINAAAIADGNVAGLFPLGNDADDYQPFYVSAPSVAPTTGGTITVSHTYTNTVTDIADVVDGASTIAVRHDSFWTCATSGVAGGTYNLRVEGTGFGEIGSVADLRLMLSGSVVGTAGTNGGSVSNPQVNRTGLTLAQLTNSFYISSVDATNTPLPIELYEFSAFVGTDQLVHIRWTTLSETNNDYFEIERSVNGNDWTAIATIAGGGTTLEPRSYTYTDAYPLAGKSYYRLRQSDYDGTAEYFDAVAVKNSLSTPISIYPSPAAHQLQVRLGDIPMTDVNIYDLAGQRFELDIEHQTGELLIDVTPLTRGLYLLKIVRSGLVDQYRFYKK